MDRGLVEAAMRGDREAYADLLRARGDRLFAIAHRILRDVDRTEDALQDALVIAWRDLPGLRDPDRFDAWLHRIVVRSCVAEAARSTSPRPRATTCPWPIATASTSSAQPPCRSSPPSSSPSRVTRGGPRPSEDA